MTMNGRCCLLQAWILTFSLLAYIVIPATASQSNEGVCHICGATATPTRPNVKVSVPGLVGASVTCADTLDQAIISASTCSALQSNKRVQRACGCQEFIKGGEDCTTATPITAGQTLYGSTIGAAPLSDFCQTHTVRPDVWYRFVGTGGKVTIDTCEYSDFITLVDVMNGTCSNQNCLPHDRVPCPNNPSAVSISLFTTLKQAYYVLVWGSPDGPDEGNFALRLTKEDPPLPSSRSAMAFVSPDASA